MRSVISGVQIPTAAKLNIDGELTLDAAAGTSGQVLTSAGAGNTPTWTNIPSGLSASSYVVSGGLSGNQSISVASTDTLVAFVDNYDPQNWWDPTAKRFQPTIAGYYSISYGVLWSALSSTNQTNMQMRKNGNTEIIQQRSPDANIPYFMNATKVIYLNGSTDYVEFTVWSPVTTQSLQQATGSSGTYFTAALVTSGANITSNALTISSPLSGSSFNGSSAVSIALSSGYGDTQNPYASKTANTFLAAPNGSNGVPTFRSIAIADTPFILHTPASDNVVATTTTANATMTGSAFSKIATLSASTTYQFECLLLVKTIIGSGTGSGNFSLTWGTGGGGGPTGVIEVIYTPALAASTTSTTTNNNVMVNLSTNLTLNGTVTGTQYQRILMKGIIRSGSVSAYNVYPILTAVNSATPGVTSSITTLVGSYIRYIPLTSSGSDVNVGTWV